MIILKGNKLTHVDSSLDVLQHYGVKGMKWDKSGQGVEALTEEEKQLQYQNRLANLDGEYDKYAQSMGNDPKKLSRDDFKNSVGNTLRRRIAESKTKTVYKNYSRYDKAMGNSPKKLSRSQFYNKSMASLNKTIRANGGKPVNYRARMEDYAK